MRRRLVVREASDQGTIGILSLGFAVLAITLILVVASATAVHVARLRLTHLADELAMDAADAVDKDAYYRATAGGPDPRLAEALMQDAVAAHADRRDGGHLEGVQVVSVTSPDGQTAVVTVRLTVYPLFGLEALMPFADGIVLTATGEARGF